MKTLIIDTDPGNGIPGANVDDAFAIAMALLHPEVELLGITTVAGNVDVDDATSCALQLLEVAGRPDVSVCRGADQPLVSDPALFRAALKARSADERVSQLWYGIPYPNSSLHADRRSAVEFLVDTITSNPGEITLVTVGPLTNVAAAIQLEPDIAGCVQSIVMMAGAVRVPGTTTAATELNASFDPEATHIVINSGAPITLVPLDVTTQILLTAEELDQLYDAGTPLAEYLSDIAEPWLRYVMERRHLPGCWLHDPLAVAVVVDPTLVLTEPMYVEVELASPRFRGQTVGWDPGFPYLLPPPNPPNVQVCKEVDADRFKAMLMDTLTAL